MIRRAILSMPGSMPALTMSQLHSHCLHILLRGLLLWQSGARQQEVMGTAMATKAVSGTLWNVVPRAVIDRVVCGSGDGSQGGASSGHGDWGSCWDSFYAKYPWKK